ncbi:hypothetical protein ONZ43_g3717 [Nemania bipapillata]|uniref:Uncharacterized protein n=1 Tax=Nemania bipapillata TaxID=110536 RepID=A0ACC2IVV5_9PEZI|nr:hypothetical protein ONZ43_g3717 [Nemania bipapillata]
MEKSTNGHIPAFPRPIRDQKHDMLPHPIESRKHALPSPDPAIGAFDRFDRQFKLPLCPPPSYSQTRESPVSFPDHQNTELAPIKSMAEKNDDIGHYGASKNGISGSNSNDNNSNNQSLPSLSSITASAPPSSTSPSIQQFPSSSQRPPEPAYPPPAPPPLTHWPSLNPLTAYYTPSHVQDPEPPLRMDTDVASKSTSSAASPDRFPDGRASSVSLDDPAVRMAAEALGDLRAGQFCLFAFGGVEPG